MADMAPVDLPYLQVYTVDGKRFAYYRRAGRRDRLPDPSDPGFAAAYEQARLRAEQRAAQPVAAPPPRALPRSLRALIQLYKASPDYLQLAPASKAGYDRLLAPIEARFGDAPVAEASRDWVQRRQLEMIATPRTANYRIAVIKKIFSFGVDQGWLASNPATGIKPLKLLTEEGEANRVWTAAEIATMTGPGAGDVALPVLIALHTAQRQSDVLRLTWSAYDGASIRLRQGKTGVALVIPVSADLRIALNAERTKAREENRAALVICLTASGRPWTSDWFKHRFAAKRADLGVADDCHFHGLRHTAATRLAERGGTDAEIQAMTGHKTRAMVARYTQGAEQETLALSAVKRMRAKKRS